MYWEWEYQETKLRDKEKAGKIKFMVKSVSYLLYFIFIFLDSLHLSYPVIIGVVDGIVLVVFKKATLPSNGRDE